MYQKLYTNNQYYQINKFIESNDLDEKQLDKVMVLQELNTENIKYEYYDFDKSFSIDSGILRENISVPIPIAKNLYEEELKKKFIELINDCLKQEFEK